MQETLSLGRIAGVKVGFNWSALAIVVWRRQMYVSTTLVLAVGLASVTTMAVRPYAPPEPWLRLSASVMPLALVVAAVLAAVASD